MKRDNNNDFRVHYELTPFDLAWYADTRDFYTEAGELLVLKRQFGAAFKRDGRIVSVPAGTRTKEPAKAGGRAA